MSETGEEVQDESPAIDDELDFDVDNVEIEEGDYVFMVIVHPVNFICASSTVSGRLAEAFAKNSMLKGCHKTVPTVRATLTVLMNNFSLKI
jgi:hypothetical protein